MAQQTERPIQVLLVDENAMFRQALAESLEREDDIEVVGSASVMADALTVIRTSEPDVVVLDPLLPDSEGAYSIEVIKEIRPESKIIMVTQSAEEQHLLSALEAGVAGYLTKDVGVEGLIEAIRAVMEGEAVVPPDMLAKVLPFLQRRDQRPVPHLTPRELEVLQLLANGRPNRDIAEELFLSPATVRNHVQNIITKLGTHSKLEAVAEAVRSGIIRVT